MRSRATSCTASATLDRHVDDNIDPVIVVPLAGDRAADIGLVLVVGADDLDLLAVDRAAEIGDRHLGRFDRAGAADVGVETRHVVHDANLDEVSGNLRVGRGRQCQRGGDAGESG